MFKRLVNDQLGKLKSGGE